MLQAVCGQCQRKVRHYIPSKWFLHIWDLYIWKEGGYPFGKDDLTAKEWRGLGMIQRELQMMELANNG
jgi:hypothetical protein